ERRPGRGARGDCPRGGAPSHLWNGHDLLPRRDPQVQQGAAGRAASRRGGGVAGADRGDDREPLFRGELGAAVAVTDIRAATFGGARGGGAAAPRATGSGTRDRRAARGP